MGGRTRAGMALLVAGVIGLAAALAPSGAAAEGGETPTTVTVERGVQTFNLAVLPKRLPATSAATLRLSLDEEGTGGVPPGIAAETIRLDRSIAFHPRGIPICLWGIQIDAAGPNDCGEAIIGHADAEVMVALPENKPIRLDSRGTIYNGGADRLLIKLPFTAPVNGT